MRSKYIGVVVTAAALAFAGSGTALAAAGGVPSTNANCLGQANAGGANGGFVSEIATSEAAAMGELAKGFGSSGGAGYPASHDDCG